MDKYENGQWKTRKTLNFIKRPLKNIKIQPLVSHRYVLEPTVLK